jgi:hypothetical protein
VRILTLLLALALAAAPPETLHLGAYSTAPDCRISCRVRFVGKDGTVGYSPRMTYTSDRLPVVYWNTPGVEKGWEVIYLARPDRDVHIPAGTASWKVVADGPTGGKWRFVETREHGRIMRVPGTGAAVGSQIRRAGARPAKTLRGGEPVSRLAHNQEKASAILAPATPDRGMVAPD